MTFRWSDEAENIFLAIVANQVVIAGNHQAIDWKHVGVSFKELSGNDLDVKTLKKKFNDFKVVWYDWVRFRYIVDRDSAVRDVTLDNAWWDRRRQVSLLWKIVQPLFNEVYNPFHCFI